MSHIHVCVVVAHQNVAKNILSKRVRMGTTLHRRCTVLTERPGPDLSHRRVLFSRAVPCLVRSDGSLPHWIRVSNRSGWCRSRSRCAGDPNPVAVLEVEDGVGDHQCMGGLMFDVAEAEVRAGCLDRGDHILFYATGPGGFVVWDIGWRDGGFLMLAVCGWNDSPTTRKQRNETVVEESLLFPFSLEGRSNTSSR